ncbi:MAG: ABC transporter substrate-binding protein [Verrucomicrobiota bacterium]
MKKYLSALLVYLTVSLSIVNGSTGEVERLNTVIDAAIEAIYGEPYLENTAEQKQARVRKVIEAEYDLTVIIRRAIGRNWNLMSPPEQERVLELVKQLVVKAYVSGMNGKDRPVVKLGKLVSVSEKRAEIPSTIVLDGQAIKVLYRLGKLQSGWQIYDIVAEDISVVSNYREQIDDHFRKGDGKELISKLEELLSKENLDEEINI